MKIYISGKIEGCENWVENFNAVEWIYKTTGTVLYNPVKMRREVEKRVQNPALGDYMKHCIAKLLQSDQVYQLPNWETSKEAQAEKTVAEVCGIPIEKIDEAALDFIITKYRKNKSQNGE